MLRRALPSLFCALALAAPAYSQDVFVPRELKAQPAHPPKESKAEAKPEKPKEIVRKAEAVTDSKPAKDDATTKKVAKTEVATDKKDKAPAKEKSGASKAPAPADDIVTIQVQKPTVAKEPAPPKTVAKTEPPKEKKEKTVAAKKDSDDDLPTIKVE
jgi:hypothetical protein